MSGLKLPPVAMVLEAAAVVVAAAVVGAAVVLASVLAPNANPVVVGAVDAELPQALIAKVAMAHTLHASDRFIGHLLSAVNNWRRR
jgi:hypothetical protein